MSFLGKEKAILIEKSDSFVDKFILEEALKMFGNKFISFELYATDMGFATHYKTSATEIKRNLKPNWKATLEEIRENSNHPLHAIMSHERASMYSIIQFCYRGSDGREKLDTYAKKYLWKTDN
jgi:hypothetical protein